MNDRESLTQEDLSKAVEALKAIESGFERLGTEGALTAQMQIAVTISYLVDLEIALTWGKSLTEAFRSAAKGETPIS